jgi:uncharacterized protein
MDNVILVAFITGLTAGGLSCFAVQGGLLTASIAQRVEADAAASVATSQRSPAAQPKPAPQRSAAPQRSPGGQRSTVIKKKAAPAPFQAGMIQPIMLFMLAKLVAYTLLGFLLGALGSMFTFSPFLKGAIQVAIGVFLVGNALRMFNVHPIFRYFSFEPPSSVTRFIRQKSKNGDRWATPLFMGALTILIPCGVTQAMMAVAIGTGSAMLGAVIMFAFVVGTMPTFVGISWIATSVGGMFQKYFYPAVAVIVLGLGLYAVNGGLTLMGSPVSYSKFSQALGVGQVSAAEPAGAPQGISPVPGLTSARSAPAASAPSAGKVAQINVANSGYSPEVLALPAGQEIELHLVSNNTHSCSRAFVIPALDIQALLPETGEKVVTIPAQAAGTTIDFMCSMGMYTGVMQFK